MRLHRITIDPSQMDGAPCIRSMRITVAMVLGQLEAHRSVEGVLEAYPYLEREDVLAAVEYAEASISDREALPAQPG